MPFGVTRRGTAADLNYGNESLGENVFAYETDTRKMKLGDGRTPYTDLPYLFNNTEQVFSLADFGAESDGETDDTLALSSALDAAKAANGGVILFPAGTTVIDSGAIDMSFDDHEGTVIMRGVPEARVKIQNGATNKIRIRNARLAIVENLVFIGNEDESEIGFDETLFHFDSCFQVLVRDCIFAGIQMGGNTLQSGVIYTKACHTTVLRCQFGGCGSTNTLSTIKAEDWLSLRVEDCQFPDYATIDGIYYEITGTIAAWIHGFNVGTTNATRVIQVNNCVFDEGATSCVYSYGGGIITINNSFLQQGIAEAVKVQSSPAGGLIQIRNTRIATTGTGGAGRAAIYSDSAPIEIDRVTFANDTNYIWADTGTGAISIRRSTLNAGVTYPTGLRNTANADLDWNENTSRNINNISDNALISDNLIVYTNLTAGRTVTLPTAVGIKGKVFTIKDGAGTAGSNNITLDPNGSETVDGSGTIAISTNWGSRRIISNGANWITV